MSSKLFKNASLVTATADDSKRLITFSIVRNGFNLLLISSNTIINFI